MKFEEYMFTIGANFLSALINGDTSGLSAAESKELASWETYVIQANVGVDRSAHWSPTDKGHVFGRCAITAMRGPVEEVTLCVEPVMCRAFLRCENHATTHIDNAVLGKVPACARCAKRLQEQQP